MNDENNMVVGFACTSNRDTNWNFNKVYPEGTTWDEIVRDFASWLSAVYGYDLTEKIRCVDSFNKDAF